MQSGILAVLKGHVNETNLNALLTAAELKCVKSMPCSGHQSRWLQNEFCGARSAARFLPTAKIVKSPPRSRAHGEPSRQSAGQQFGDYRHSRFSTRWVRDDHVESDSQALKVAEAWNADLAFNTSGVPTVVGWENPANRVQREGTKGKRFSRRSVAKGNVARAKRSPLFLQ